MNEGDLHSVGAVFGFLVDQGNLGLIQAGQLLLDIVGSQGQMVKTRAPLLQKLADGRVFGGGLKQLDSALAQGEDGHPNFLFRNRFITAQLESQMVSVEGNGLFQAVDGDSDVVNRFYTHLDTMKRAP